MCLERILLAQSRDLWRDLSGADMLGAPFGVFVLVIVKAVLDDEFGNAERARTILALYHGGGQFASTNKGLDDLVHVDGRHHPRLRPHIL